MAINWQTCLVCPYHFLSVQYKLGKNQKIFTEHKRQHTTERNDFKMHRTEWVCRTICQESNPNSCLQGTDVTSVVQFLFIQIDKWSIANFCRVAVRGFSDKNRSLSWMNSNDKNWIKCGHSFTAYLIFTLLQSKNRSVS